MAVARMRRAFLTALVSSFAASAVAQAPLRTKPYEVLTAQVPAPADPQAAAAFTKIRDAVVAKDEALLAASLSLDFVAVACPADPTAHCGPKSAPASDRKRTPLERLRLTLCCGGKDDPTIPASARTEALFGVLDSLLQGGTPAVSTDFGEAVCDPAMPAIDRGKAAALAKRLDIDAATMRLAAAPIEARQRADRTAPVAVTFPKGAVVPLLTSSATPVPDGWTALALPAGGIGFAEGMMLEELAPESLCLRKGKDGWKAAFLIGRQS